MQEITADVDRWREAGESVALATVIQTWGSSPRKVGAKMALTPDGKISGSVSGGCVEGTVFEQGVEVLESGRPRLLSFGVADETAWEVGLACGGQIQVFVQAVEGAIYEQVRQLVLQDSSMAIATVVQGEGEWLGGQLVMGLDGVKAERVPALLRPAILQATQNALQQGQSQRVPLENHPGVELFIEVSLSAPVLIMVGGVHIAIALTSIAKTLGYQTVVIDPRRAFGTTVRFSHVDRLIQAWPQKAFEQITITPNTAVAMLTHDPKIDDPALKVVLNSPAFYVGALGSQQTQTKRRQRLTEAGLTETQIQRIHGPIGINIYAQTPEEIALSVMAEIVKTRRQLSSKPLNQ